MHDRSNIFSTVKSTIQKFIYFIGPGLILSCSYTDPGNYSESVAAGSVYKYKLCFVIFMANIFAVILQVLCIKLGTISGLDLAECCRLYLPAKLNLFLYLSAEIAIIATDLAEVVGTAISLEILFGIPLLFGVLITVLDVLVILMVYKKDGRLKETRTFEIIVSFLVGATCICFILELFQVNFEPGSGWEIFKGFLPTNKEIFIEKEALFLGCGTIGATVMPHSLFLGSSIVMPRLKDYDEKNGTKNVNNQVTTQQEQLPQRRLSLSKLSDPSELINKYKPSYSAIKYCLNYSYIELIVSLSGVAIFVNCAILIVSAATLYGKPDAQDADLLSIYDMLVYYISPVAGLVFALSMLFSGQSAGIVCTMAGQIVSEGFINWTVEPWKRRVITRVIAIVPVLIVIGVLGREGVSKVMNSSQVVLSFILPIASAPLIYFTCKKEYMTVDNNEIDQEANEETPLVSEKVNFANGSFLKVASILTWLIISALNLYLVIAFIYGADI
ncbi:unnamed protein product [Candida verbasci]|uniref:Uncharacterized protein n=1 Tax=Candida verbasci TaxID=1227364 RepID=A0A9W4XFJ1_9ASCO|nr:unnamed protein product [Candida verbasci]